MLLPPLLGIIAALGVQLPAVLPELQPPGPGAVPAEAPLLEAVHLQLQHVHIGLSEAYAPGAGLHALLPPERVQPAAGGGGHQLTE